MKKLIVIALAICGMSVMAASEYMVYDFTMSAKTTKAKARPQHPVVMSMCGVTVALRRFVV